MVKTVPISIRITQDDADFLTSLQIEDAITPSDKIRALIRQAKHQQKQNQEGYETHLQHALDSLKQLIQQVKSGELEHKEHSELVTSFIDWLAESYAFVSSAKALKGSPDLQALEEGIADRSFRLLETMARMGVTAKAPCYNKDIISNGFKPLKELTELVNSRVGKMEDA